MRKFIIPAALLLSALCYADNGKHLLPRELQYYPEDNSFVCVNGKNRYTRALYGGVSEFRLETSDVPVFATYVKGNCKNISFALVNDGKRIALDSLDNCKASYTAGLRSYTLTDSRLAGMNITIDVLALHDRDGAIWRISNNNEQAQYELSTRICNIRNQKLNRAGDLGVDAADSFEADTQDKTAESISFKLSDISYILLVDNKLSVLSSDEGESIYSQAEMDRLTIANSLIINTPDRWLNTLGGTLATAADGIWNGEVWLHGAVGWRMPLSGWRAAYVGDAMGWHDRARKHFDAYAESQVTDVPITISHPAQDSTLNLARSLKQWGTPQYSNGYICRNPHRNDQMHHYDMNLCYIDELLWHLKWTGDTDYIRKMWPMITRHLAWEKANYDPDNDGLYDAYACIWASDALYYNSGAVTHSSAYNYRANALVAELAEKIGENPQPYRDEADKILNAINSRLWLADKGHWAEYQDYMGLKRTHEDAAVWTIYHAIDSDISTPEQAYQATRYIDTNIPHIPVVANGLPGGEYSTISTTDWQPYSWSINNVAFGEVLHTALAYFEAGRNDDGYKLLKSSILDGMYLGASPGNIGQISYYDAARGECYRDFGDPIGVMSRTVLQGLFGINPDAVNGKLTIRPGFPTEWNDALISMSDLTYSFYRNGLTDSYHIQQDFAKPMALTLQVNATRCRINAVKANGKSVNWRQVDAANGYPNIAIDLPAQHTYDITIEWSGDAIYHISNEGILSDDCRTLDIYTNNSVAILGTYDPQNVLSKISLFKKHLRASTTPGSGDHTFFVRTRQGNFTWLQPVNINLGKTPAENLARFDDIRSEQCRMVCIDNLLNASVNDIFENKYLSPRSPYTTLQLPTQGIGEWCHPKMTAEISDSTLRTLAVDSTFTTSIGIPFRIISEGNDIAYTSLWDNYPNSVSFDLEGNASHAYLLLAGSTNHMQSHIENGYITITYADGTSKTVSLVNPDNWCPIEQDYYIDGKAFKAIEPRPYRLHLQSGTVSRNLSEALGLGDSINRIIPGGAATMLDVALDNSKQLQSLTLTTTANDVIIGLMSITLQ
jgi:hypothetical protein